MTAFSVTQEALCMDDSIKYCCACSFMWDGPLQNEEKIDRQPKGGPFLTAAALPH